MSIEALPNELLGRIFFHLRWDSLRNLSLVNRRWNQVIGQRATLKISNYIPRMRGSVHYEDICIPREVLCGSLREYSEFSCSMRTMDVQMMSGSFGSVLEYCHQRWNMNALHIASCYDQLILFLQHHKHLLNDVIRAEISVRDYPSKERLYNRSTGCATHDFDLPMEQLQHLDLSYAASSFCSLSVHAPKLEILKVNRFVMKNKVRLTIRDSTKLNSILIQGHDYSGSTSDPAELQSIPPQTSKTIRLELVGCSIETTFSAMFGNLHTIILTCVTITPTDDPLECLNLTKLYLIDVILQKPLKLRVPQLHTLICDIKALCSALHLQDTFKADLLAIDAIFDNSGHYKTVDLSSFRRLHLLLWPYSYVLWDTAELDFLSICWIWPNLSGITELTLQSYAQGRTFDKLGQLWKHFPQLNTLRLLGMNVPDNFNFLPVNVQNVTIENCSTEGSSIEFPPSVERVRVKQLWKHTEDGNSAGMILLPPNRYALLESGIVQVMGPNGQMVSRMAYSTKDCHELNHMDIVFPRTPRHDWVGLRPQQHVIPEQGC